MTEKEVNELSKRIATDLEPVMQAFVKMANDIYNILSKMSVAINSVITHVSYRDYINQVLRRNHYGSRRRYLDDKSAQTIPQAQRTAAFARRGARRTYTQGKSRRRNRCARRYAVEYGRSDGRGARDKAKGYRFP